MLVYVRKPIRQVMLSELAQLQTPGIAVMLQAEEDALAQQAPLLTLIDRGSVVSNKTSYKVVEIQPLVF